MSWAILPTFDYIDWMKIRKTTTVKIPILGNKNSFKLHFFNLWDLYGLSNYSVLIKLVRIFKFGLPDQDRFASKL